MLVLMSLDRVYSFDEVRAYLGECARLGEVYRHTFDEVRRIKLRHGEFQEVGVVDDDDFIGLLNKILTESEVLGNLENALGHFYRVVPVEFRSQEEIASLNRRVVSLIRSKGFSDTQRQGKLFSDLP